MLLHIDETVNKMRCILTVITKWICGNYYVSVYMYNYSFICEHVSHSQSYKNGSYCTSLVGLACITAHHDPIVRFVFLFLCMYFGPIHHLANYCSSKHFESGKCLVIVSELSLELLPVLSS